MLEFVTSKGTIKTKGGVKLKMKSPLFNNYQLIGTYSNPFELPLFANEKKIFGFPDRITSVNSKKELAADVYRNGKHIRSGTFVLSKAKDNIASSYFKGEVSVIAKKISNTYLDELNLGSISFETEQDLLNALRNETNSIVPGLDFCAPTIYNPEMVTLDDETGENAFYNKPFWINPVFYNLNYYYVMDYLGKKVFLCPMLYMKSLLKKIFNSLGYIFVDQVYSGQLAKQVLFSMYTITNQDDRTVINYTDLVPHYLVSDFLIDIQNHLAAEFHFNDFSKTVTFKYKNSYFQNSVNPLEVTHEKPEIQFTGFKKGIAIKQIKDGDDNHFFNKTWWVFDYSSLAGSVPTMEDLPDLNDYKGRRLFVMSKGHWYKPYTADEENWYWALDTTFENYLTEYHNAFQQFNGGLEEFLKIETNLTPLGTEDGEDICFAGYKYEDRKKIKPRFIFKGQFAYNEVQQNVNENYRCASNTNEIGDYSWFLPEKPYIILNFWRSFIEFLWRTKYVDVKIKLTPAQLSNWDWEQPVKIGNTQVLADELDADLSSEGDIICELRGYTL